MAEESADRKPSVQATEPQDSAELAGSQDRWNAAVSTFSTLRQDSQAILEQIRQSMHEMRTLKARLHANPGAPGPNGGATPELDAAAHFQLQHGLTPREMQVAMLLGEGRSNEEVASALDVSPHTARHHTQHVLAKLGVHSRAQAGAKIRNWPAGPVELGRSDQPT
jgi:DNA-binding CsgD family transcriptional regulator